MTSDTSPGSDGKGEETGETVQCELSETPAEGTPAEGMPDGESVSEEVYGTPPTEGIVDPAPPTEGTADPAPPAAAGEEGTAPPAAGEEGTAPPAAGEEGTATREEEEEEEDTDLQEQQCESVRESVSGTEQSSDVKERAGSGAGAAGDMTVEETAPAPQENPSEPSANEEKATSSTLINVAPTKSLGKLRLALSYDSDSLIVSILEACDIQIPEEDTSCNPYVKILLGTTGDKELHQTKVVSNSRDPAFRETFLVKIEEEDAGERLIISLWNQGDVEDYSCGGMSFAIEEYAKPNMSVNGWYYLLQGDEADKSSTRCVEPIKNHVVSSKSISLTADKRSVKIQRNTKSLGFAVVNDNPVIVTSVENGGPAAAGGLLKGDMILSVNGKEVSELSCAYVSKLLRACGDSVEMIVQQAPRDILSNPCYSPDLINGVRDSDHTTLPPVVLDWDTLPPLEQKRQQAIQDLIRSEDNYLTDIRFGIERYLTPLKAEEFMTPERHEKLFNNIKEVADITRKVLKSLTISRVPLINYKSSNPPFYIYSIGEVYRENSCQLVREYEQYLTGRKSAHQEFTRLQNCAEFLAFLQQPPALPDLCNILQQPREHIGSLPCLLQGVLSTTPLHHPDQAHLGHVIQVLSSLSRTSPTKKKSEARKMTDIQERLIFSSSVKPFPIKEGDRVLVHEGSLYKLDKKKKHKVYAMLFTDLLLLTKEVGQHLKVIQEPMYLSQLMIQDFNCEDGTEFHITVVATQPNGSDKVMHGDTYVFRGKTTESKEQWKKYIGERAGGVDKIRKRESMRIHTLPCLPQVPSISDPEGTSDDDRPDPIYMAGPNFPQQPKNGGHKSVYPQKKKTGSCADNAPTAQQAKKWQESIENLLHDKQGRSFFNRYLVAEYASENLDFWTAVDTLKQKKPSGEKLKKEVKEIFDTYIGDNAEKQINVNGQQRRAIEGMMREPNTEMFDDAQRTCVRLMKEGTYLRFIQNENIQNLIRGQG